MNSSPQWQILSLGRLPSNFTLNPICISLNGVLWFCLTMILVSITFHPRWPCAQLKNRILSLGKIHSVWVRRVNQHSMVLWQSNLLSFPPSPSLSLSFCLSTLLPPLLSALFTSPFLPLFFLWWQFLWQRNLLSFPPSPSILSFPLLLSLYPLPPFQSALFTSPLLPLSFLWWQFLSVSLLYLWQFSSISMPWSLGSKD